MKRQITAINQERKLSQTVAGSELRKAEHEYFELLAKNTQVRGGGGGGGRRFERVGRWVWFGWKESVSVLCAGQICTGQVAGDYVE